MNELREHSWFSRRWARARLVLANALANLAPRYWNVFRKIRPCIYRIVGGLDFGSQVLMYGGTQILGRRVRIGANTFVGANCYFACSDDVEVRIGECCDISFGVSFVCGTHFSGSHDRRAGVGFQLPIQVGSGTWIGCNVTILPGVTLGNGVIVGAGALVNRSFGDDVVIAGVPARVIRSLEPATNSTEISQVVRDSLPTHASGQTSFVGGRTVE